VFVRDLDAGTTTLISARVPERLSSTGLGLMTLMRNSLSADGRVVVFASTDNGLVEGDTNLGQDIFVRDLVAATNVNVSLCTNSGSGRTNSSSRPQISADGRYVAFFQRAMTNLCWVDLSTGDTRNIAINSGLNIELEETGGLASPNFALSSDGRYLAYEDWISTVEAQIHLRDMFDPSGADELVSVSWSGTSPGDRGSTRPTFSPDNRWVAFLSSSFTLTTNLGTGFGPQLYARDLVAKRTRMTSIYPDGLRMTNAVTNAIFSADSRSLFFNSRDSGASIVYRHDLLAETNSVVCSNCFNPSPNADGRLVAYETVVTPMNSDQLALSEVVVIDLETGQTNQVGVDYRFASVPITAAASPVLSYDGHYVVFTSVASNLVPNDVNGTRDVFVGDLWAGATMLVSLNMDGTGSGNALSTTAVLAADGRTVLFQSFASDLVPGDYNDTRDIFVLHLGGPDTDGDGMEDDWEMAYFNTLARDGTGDFDGDGRTDLQEFRSGTNPANDASVLRVLTLNLAGANSTTVLWSAAPGRTYRVQFKNAADDAAWTDLEGDVVTAGTTGSKGHTAVASDRRFYRVRLVEEWQASEDNRESTARADALAGQRDAALR
jgi:Tol biopolymer transport system component